MSHSSPRRRRFHFRQSIRELSTSALTHGRIGRAGCASLDLTLYLPPHLSAQLEPSDEAGFLQKRCVLRLDVGLIELGLKACVPEQALTTIGQKS